MIASSARGKFSDSPGLPVEVVEGGIREIFDVDNSQRVALSRVFDTHILGVHLDKYC